jgi:hypothetical protein
MGFTTAFSGISHLCPRKNQSIVLARFARQEGEAHHAVH